MQEVKYFDMINRMKSIIFLILLFIGEAIYIYSEMIIAYTAKSNENSNSTILRMAIIASIAGLVIIAGYYYGYKFSKNIWLVTATSIGAILITEPIVSWLIFHEIPNRGASVGLFFGFLGILSTLFL